jgi:MotA/TolQ/ExbB proton channel family
VTEVLQLVSRASKRSSAVVHEEMKGELYSLATIASLAPWVGIFGTILGIVNSFGGGVTGEKTAIMAAFAKRLSESLWPTAFGLLVGLVSLWFYLYLSSKLRTIDLEMENASLELLNLLSRFPSPFRIEHATDRRLFGEMSFDDVARDERFQRRCLFLAGAALVLAWFAQTSRYVLVDSISLGSAVRVACFYLPIVFGLSCLPMYLVWVKLLGRRPGGLIALGSVFCLCWTVAELVLGRHLP